MKERLKKHRKKILILVVAIISFVGVVCGASVVKAYTDGDYEFYITVFLEKEYSTDGNLHSDSSNHACPASQKFSAPRSYNDSFLKYKIDLPVGYTWGLKSYWGELIFYEDEYTYGELMDLGFLKQNEYTTTGWYEGMFYRRILPAKYTVNYNANGGSGTMSSSSHVYDSWANLNANAFTRTGYTFQGWSTSSTATTATYGDMASVANLSTTHGGSVTLYAVWKPNTYTVSFSGNGGSVSSTSKSVTYNSTYGTLPTATRKGYTFTGWYTATSGGTKISSSSTFSRTANQTLYAQWTHNKYKITYNANGGSTSAAAKNYYYNDAVDLSPIAQKDGMIFVGWSTSKTATRPLASYKMPDLATSSNSAYADWEVTLYAVYSIPVSDVENHTYPAYTATPSINNDEVYLVVWKKGNTSNFRTYPLTYNSTTNPLVYKYKLSSTNVSSFVGTSAYCYQIVAFDNAGNSSVLYKGSSDGSSVTVLPTPKKYVQTVIHYRYDIEKSAWKQFDVTTKTVLEGTTYTPAYITPPTGHKASRIDGAYVVKGAKTSGAYYEPIEYSIIFNANGGSCSVSNNPIKYGERYIVRHGKLPEPTRTGYHFTGWNTKKDGTGEKFDENSQHLIAGNRTVYAQWEVNSYKVTYDYWTNGGSRADLPSAEVNYNTSVDLGKKAYKTGWEFVGWNTDAKATTGLSSMKMPAQDITLYAVFKKDITLTVVEVTNDGQKTRSETKTIYNTDTHATFQMTEENSWSNWTLLGWTDGTNATDAPIVGIGTEYDLSESGTLYGVYASTVTLSYDTNGSSMEINDQTQDSYYNASGSSAYPTFVIEDGPALSQHSFVSWKDSSGNEYTPGTSVTFDKDTLLTASWNKHPKIEAYDRYFTLEQAQNGKITETALLEKVVGTDLEDGTLVNGTDVIVKDYNESTFTSLGTDTKIEITYQATDSFGNTVTKTITVNVTDTSMKKSSKKTYVRFISDKFFEDDNGNLIAADQGGLEETSVWRNDSSYFGLLQRIFTKEQTNSEKETWIFQQEDIKNMKNYTNTYGLVLKALDTFYQFFLDCRQTAE